MTRLQQHWHAVVATYYPRWANASQWRCTTRTRRTAQGHCGTDRRVVEIGIVSDDDDALDLVLIHEVAHAVASLGHGKTWQGRMTLAAGHARKLGRTHLAELIDKQVARYRDRGEGLEVAYTEVQDALLSDPDLTLGQVRRWLAQMYGLLPGEIDSHFGGLTTVYKKGRKEGLEFRQERLPPALSSDRPGSRPPTPCRGLLQPTRRRTGWPI